MSRILVKQNFGMGSLLAKDTSLSSKTQAATEEQHSTRQTSKYTQGYQLHCEKRYPTRTNGPVSSETKPNLSVLRGIENKSTTRMNRNGGTSLKHSASLLHSNKERMDCISSGYIQEAAKDKHPINGTASLPANRATNSRPRSSFSPYVNCSYPVDKNGMRAGSFYKSDRDSGYVCDISHTSDTSSLQQSLISPETRKLRNSKTQSPTIELHDVNSMSSDYSEPLSPDSIYCGNIVKARFTDGKLYRGEIVKINYQAKQCLIEFMQHSPTWCSTKHIYPSTPLKSQVIKRLMAKNRSARHARRLSWAEQSADEQASSENLPSGQANSDFKDHDHLDSYHVIKNHVHSPRQTRQTMKDGDPTMTLLMEVDSEDSNQSEASSKEKRNSSSTSIGLHVKHAATTKCSYGKPSQSIPSKNSLVQAKSTDTPPYNKERARSHPTAGKPCSKPTVLNSVMHDDVTSLRSNGHAAMELSESSGTKEDAEEVLTISSTSSKGEEAELEEELSDIYCELCRGGDSDPPNEIVLCDKCGLGYHQMCHDPVITAEVIEEQDMEWYCQDCSAAIAVIKSNKRRAAAAVESSAAVEGVTGGLPTDLLAQVRPTNPWRWTLPKTYSDLPYDASVLRWDERHVENEQRQYCYCGGNGRWFMQMLQCHSCRMWYHQDCIQSLKDPLLYGDRFYTFLCALCNHGEEFKMRLHVRWVDFVHLTMFHLCIMLGKREIDFDQDFMPFVDENLRSLDLPKEIEEYDLSHIDDQLYMILQEECATGRFRCVRKGSGEGRGAVYALCVRCPPAPPLINLPPARPLTGRNTSTWAWKHSYRKFTPANQKQVDWDYRKPAPPCPLRRKGSSTSKAAAAAAGNQDCGNRKSVKRKRDAMSPEVKKESSKRRKTYNTKKRRAEAARETAMSQQRGEAVVRLVDVSSFPSAQQQDTPSDESQCIIIDDSSTVVKNDESAAPRDLELSPYTAQKARDCRHTLERLIPTPRDFAGYRNPFLTGVERETLFRRATYKQNAVAVCSRGAVQLRKSSLIAGFSSDDSVEECGFEPSTSSSCDESSSMRKSKDDGESGSGERSAPRKRARAARNPDSQDSGTDSRRRDKGADVVSFKEPKSLYKYEPYIVMAKRKRQGKLEYALCWDPLPF